MFPKGEKMFHRHQKKPGNHFYLFLNHRFPLVLNNLPIFAAKSKF